MPTSRDDLRLAHKALCSSFVSEDLFRRALGGPRGDISRVGLYLSIPVAQRPVVSWYFDPLFYLSCNPDIAESGVDPLLHFITIGVGNLRSPHPLIDLNFLTGQAQSPLDTPLRLEALADLLEYDLAPPSPYFDPEFYRHQFGENGAPDNGLLRHFIQFGLRAGRAPAPFLDIAWYAARYADVPSEPYQALRHFVTQGDAEGRCAGPAFDGTLYRKRYPDVAESNVPPLAHYLGFGRFEGRQAATERVLPAPSAAPLRASPPVGLALPCTPEKAQENDAGMRALVAAGQARHKEKVQPRAPKIVEVADIVRAIARLKLPRPKAPVVSVLVPMFNELDMTVACLASLRRAKPALDFEVVVADDASTDPETQRLGSVANLVYLRQERNLGFLRNCNAAYARCRGKYVLLLNNDAQVMPGALEALEAALEADGELSAAGAKLLYPDGRLQEAGCYLRPNGESSMIGLFADPNEPGYTYDRDVAYCSGAALMLRREHVGETLFDEAYAPAYCEDADLCLRLIAAGGRIRYVASAVVVHHLSVSTNRLSVARKLRRIARNQQHLCERWGDLLRKMDTVRVLAFYLPQFHPVPENDLWWGAGFTEWANVVRARPSYAGHYQPHLPADLGYYDLRLPEALRRQAELAIRYGIEGFCVYYYNFGGRRMLSAPIETVQAHPEIPFRWCLCWANENWTRHWDGGEKAILLEQKYDSAALTSIIADVVAQAADPRYLRVDGRPIFLLYRPLLLPDPAAFAASCREAFARAGFPGVHLVYVESMEAVDRRVTPADIGFDASVEFPPHGRAVPVETPADILKEDWSGYRYDYPATVESFVNRPTVPYPRYPAVFPDWDNTPRQPLKGTSFDGASPEAFRVYVEEKIEEVRAFLTGERRLLFVNAWNEWAEGAHLEPDAGHGHRWLEALRDAVAAKSWL